jgi:hypothetical protein
MVAPDILISQHQEETRDEIMTLEEISEEMMKLDSMTVRCMMTLHSNMKINL